MDEITQARITLEKYAPFKKLDEKFKSELFDLAQIRHFKKGDYIFREGDVPDGMYAGLKGILHAAFTTLNGKKFLLTFPLKNSWFGEVSTLDLNPRSFDVVANSDGYLLYLSQAKFDQLINNDFSRASFFINELCNRIRMLYYYSNVILSLPPKRKLAKVLLTYTKNLEWSGLDIPRDEIPLTQDELSSMVGVSRQSINKILVDWKNQGFIDVKRHKIKIIDPKKIIEIAG